MPVPPVDSHESQQNPFVLGQSRMFRASATIASPDPNAEKAVAKTPAQNVSGTKPKDGYHFQLSTQQIINLIVRFRLKSLSYEQLVSLPLSKLQPEEKEFINYMRRNKHVFDRISGLDQIPGSISVEDVKLAARLAGDNLMLSEDDLAYLKKGPLAVLKTVPVEDGAPVKRKLQTQDLINTLQAINPDGVQFKDLMAMSPDGRSLTGIALQSLRFMQSPRVSHMLQKVAEPYKGLITPEVLRVLTSLIWNPAIYGAMPIAYFRTAPIEEHEDIDPLVAISEPDITDDRPRNKRSRQQKPRVRLEAHHVMNICHKLSSNGHVSLKQLRKYQPTSQAEEQTLNLLRQARIFRALANLDHEPDSLSDDDIQLALAEGTIMLADPYMTLVIQP